MRGPHLLATCAWVALGAPAGAGTVIPFDGMVITESVLFEPGTYSLPNGVSIGASGITVDMNGATLVGTAFANYGVTCIGFDDVTITNGSIEGTRCRRRPRPPS
ncbi:MAG: hypothetical protein ACYS0D_02150 [Planctomycetota bacterium]|jgi:hypothetical protein